jgi:hypothetical protein
MALLMCFKHHFLLMALLMCPKPLQIDKGSAIAMVGPAL